MTAAEALVKAGALAGGLRRNLAQSAGGWMRWPNGAADLAALSACIAAIEGRLRIALETGEPDAALAACIIELRTVLEWTSYQAANVTTARALASAQRVTAFARRFGLLDDPSGTSSVLGESEAALVENIRTRNGYMLALAEQNANLHLPGPLIEPDALVPKPKPPPGKLAFIQLIRKSLRDPPSNRER